MRLTETQSGDVFTFDGLTIGADGTLLLIPYSDGDTNYTNDLPFKLNATTVTIDSGGRIISDGQGYVGTSGDGTGTGGGKGGYWVGAGGGYGGLGGNAYDGHSGGVAYGSVTEPSMLGSAGGAGVIGSTYYAGGNGGGAIRFVVSGTLTINGTLSANGSNGTAGRTGGGSGGSIWVTTNVLAGSGVIQSNGGIGSGDYPGGGGSGGRIALYYGGSLPTTLIVQTNGGSGYQAGGTGSIYTNSITVEPTTSIVDATPAEVGVSTTTGGTITVTLKNGDGQPFANKPVSVGLTSGGNVYINGQLVAPLTSEVNLGNTDVSGIATGVITSTVTEPRVLFAKSEAVVIQDQAAITFIAGAVNAQKSTLAVSSATAPADGTTPITVTVTLRDEFNNPVPNGTVALSATGNAVVTQPTNLTDANGVTQGAIKKFHLTTRHRFGEWKWRPSHQHHLG